MTEIGFDAASVGAMAAAYAAVVPLLEVPSGILADRWSRSWALILACVALMVSSLIGALSHNVITYVIAAMILGIYFGRRARATWRCGSPTTWARSSARRAASMRR
jgi:MFS family permease